MIAMGYLFGLLGIVIAPPAAAVIRDLFLYLYRRLDGYSASRALASVVTHEAPRPTTA